MRAKKENKVYVINETQKDRYLKEGYDIYSEEGKVLEYSPLKKVPYSDYMKLKESNASLQAEVNRLKDINVVLQAEVEAAKVSFGKAAEKAAKVKKEGA